MALFAPLLPDRVMPARYEVVVDIRAPAADVRRVVSRWGTVEAVDDRSCRLLMSVDSLQWPAHVLLTVGADFHVVQPADLRDFLHTTGELLTRNTPG